MEAIFREDSSFIDRPIPDFFKSTAIFRGSVLGNNRVTIPKKEKEVLGLSRGDGVRVLYLNDIFEGGSIEFTNNITTANGVTIPASKFRENDLSVDMRSKTSGIFILVKEYDNIPSFAYNRVARYLLDNTLFSKGYVDERATIENETQTVVTVRNKDLDLSNFNTETRFNISFINLDSDSYIDRVRKNGRIYESSGVYNVTIPKRFRDSFKDGDTVQVVAKKPVTLF